MNYQDIIQGFRFYTPELAERLKESWRLSMSSDVLLFCVNHYKTQEKRDPSVDELYMLDALSAIQEQTIGALAPTDLFTNDEFVAETYADLIKKRKEVNPHAAYPCTLTEAARIANAYLLRVGKHAPTVPASCAPEWICKMISAPSASCVKTDRSAFRLRLLPHPALAPQAGDRLILLTPAPDESSVSFCKKAEAFLDDEALKKHLLGVYTVKDSGILNTLLELFGSVRIDLSALSAWQETVPMTVLTNQYGASRILRVSKEEIQAVLPLLQECDIKATVFAEVSSGGNFEFFRTRQTRPILLNAQFMRLLFHYKPVKAELADEYAQEPEAIDTRVCVDRVGCDTDVASMEQLICAAASSAPMSAFFKTALYTALAPVFTLAASGLDYSKQAFSIGLELPTEGDDPKTVGEVLSTVLGIYRAQTELALVAEGLAIHADPTVKHPTVSAFALGKGAPISAELEGDGHYVYCLAPAFRENGLPDFRSLRALLDRLVDLAQTDTLLGTHVLVGESITDGLRHMSRGVGCRLTDLRVASEGALPIGILVESKKVLAYREIGVTEAKAVDIPLDENVSSACDTENA